MRLLLKFCFLLQLLSVLSEEKSSPADLANAKYCQFLAGRKFKQVCTGRYTIGMKIRYLDNKIAPNNPYAVYRAEDKESEYIASLRISELNECRLLQNVNYTKFDCKDSTNENPILLLRAGMYCFEYQVEYVDDLLTLCATQNNRPQNNAKSTRVAILYTYRSTLDEGESAAHVLQVNRLVVGLLCVLPLRL